MQISYLIIISIVTYILGSFTKLKWNKMPNKYIPLQNVLIGLISATICFVFKIQTNFINSLVLCFLAVMGAGGTSDLMQTFKKEEDDVS